MINMETKYLGLTLSNPLVVSSSGLTNSVEKVIKLEKEGIGAVILKSLFEEQIFAEANQFLNNSEGQYPEALDYVNTYVRSQNVEKYLDLIRSCKGATTIPIIASINCFSSGEWTSFAKDIEEAGADALELNIFFLNNGSVPSAEYEETYFKIVRQIKKVVSIPVSVKLSPYFSNLVSVVDRLKGEGAAGVTLFNKFYQPDIDINHLKVTAAEVFSVPTDQYQTLRWVSIVSGMENNMDISSSTGVHDYDAVLKMLLAGANTVQLCSAIYQQGAEIINQILVCMEEWMAQKEFNTIEDFRGLLNYKSIKDPSLYERSQFMKYYSSRE